MEPRPPRTEPIDTDRSSPFERHVFVCTEGPECPGDGPALEILKTFKAGVKEGGAKDTVRVTKSGCLGQCGHGPVAVVYPEAVWYSHLDAETAREVLEKHVLGGEVVPEYRFTLGPGGCKAARDADGRSTCGGECHGQA